jgi:hypothetical protein
LPDFTPAIIFPGTEEYAAMISENVAAAAEAAAKEAYLAAGGTYFNPPPAIPKEEAFVELEQKKAESQLVTGLWTGGTSQPTGEASVISSIPWKPDFTKDNPWEGMPADYAGVATFVPTSDNPLPPWEGEVGAGIIPTFGTPEYESLALTIASEARAATATATTTEEKARAELIADTAEKAALARAGVGESAAAVEIDAGIQPGWAVPAVIAIVVLAFLGRK